MSWRLILSPPGCGARNMAVDEALLKSVAEDGAPPTLRFYGWAPGCLSIGRFQPAADLTEAARAVPGETWVRRPTGGRALFHRPELTYLIAASVADPHVGGGVRASYCEIAHALLGGLARLGVEATLAPKGDPGVARRNPSCFDTPSEGEVLWGGRKLVGSAQHRGAGAFLQHGSILLGDPSERCFAGLAFASEEERRDARERGAARLATLSEALGAAPEPDAVARAFVEGFEERWGVRFEEGELSPGERSSAESAEERYRSAAWSYRR